MFTGIVTDVAPVIKAKRQTQSLELSLVRPDTWSDLALGESIAVNGVCLTVKSFNKDSFDCFLMPETLVKTAFGEQLPKKVNLERALRLGDRLGGHFVQGHVDSAAKVIKVDKTHDYGVWIELPSVFKKLVIPKGSVAVNGVALTVADLKNDRFKIALIPYTLEQTTLGTLLAGDKVNLEFDMLGKYALNVLEGEKDAKGKKDRASAL